MHVENNLVIKMFSRVVLTYCIENSLMSVIRLIPKASLVAQLVKNLPVMQETPVQRLGQEDPLEKGQATHSIILGLPWWLFCSNCTEVFKSSSNKDIPKKELLAVLLLACLLC